MTVKEIVTKYLRENGFDGLCEGNCSDEGCGCLLPDLAPCEESFLMSCEPGYKASCDCGEGCVWHVSKEKP